MLAGNVTLEDVSVGWAQAEHPHANEFNVTVCEMQGDGTQKVFVGRVPGREFMAALATALSWDGEVPSNAIEHTEWCRQVESVAAIPGMPRFMP